MQNFTDTIFLANNNLAEMLTCNAGECLSWIIVLFNILTVFYLAFCAWFKVTKSVKLFGWVWSSINVCSTILILFFHTCIFTILCAVFTGLITMAVLSIVFNKDNQNEESERIENKIKGYYVIFQTSDNKFIFRLYDKFKKYYMSSTCKYNSVEDAKIDIENCRRTGISAMVEDKTKNWIKAVDVPKFVMYSSDNGYHIDYVMIKERANLRSDVYNSIDLCLKCLNRFKTAILSDELYFSKEIIGVQETLIKREENIPKNIITKSEEIHEQTEQQSILNNIKERVEEDGEIVYVIDEKQPETKRDPRIVEVNSLVAKEEPKVENPIIQEQPKNEVINNSQVISVSEPKSANGDPFTFVYTGNIKRTDK